jgi:hypothetical protein
VLWLSLAGAAAMVEGVAPALASAPDGVLLLQPKRQRLAAANTANRGIIIIIGCFNRSAREASAMRLYTSSRRSPPEQFFNARTPRREARKDFSFCSNSQLSTFDSQLIPDPCRDGERRIDAAGFPAHTRRMANNCVNDRD